MLVVFDLDGTLSSAEHRLHYLDQRPKDWDSFHHACDQDKPIQQTLLVLESLYIQGNLIEIWTSRREDTRQKTEEWLSEVGILYTIKELKMRPFDDHNQDYQLKLSWLRERQKALKNIPDLVFEDRTRVVEMWRDHKIKCYQVAAGNF